MAASGKQRLRQAPDHQRIPPHVILAKTTVATSAPEVGKGMSSWNHIEVKRRYHDIDDLDAGKRDEQPAHAIDQEVPPQHCSQGTHRPVGNPRRARE